MKNRWIEWGGVGLVVVLLGIGVWMAMGGGEEEGGVRQEKRVGGAKRVGGRAASDAAGSAGAAAAEVTPDSAVEAEPPLPPKKPGKVVQARSSSSGRVMTLMDGTVVTNTPRVFFKRDFERALLAASHPGSMSGALVAGLRARYSDDEILAMLREQILPADGDDETTAGVKNRVQDLKDAALDAIANGASVDEILDELRSYNAQLNLMKARAFKLRQEAVKTGDAELVRESVRRINEELEAEGLRPISVPVQFREEEEE